MENFSTKYDIDESLLNEMIWVLNSELPIETDWMEKAPRFVESNIIFVKPYEK